MPTLAEMMVAGAMDSTDPHKINNTTQAFASGAQIAMQAQEVQQRRAQIEQQKEQLELQKLNFITDAVEKGLTKVPKKAQAAYFRGMRDNMAGKLGIGITDEFFDALTSPDVNQGAVGETMVKFRTATRQGMRTGDFSESKAYASEILAAMGGDTTKFGEFMNSVMGSEASARATEMTLGQKVREYNEEPTRTTDIALRKELGQEAAKYDPSTVDANLKAIDEVIVQLEKGKKKEKDGLVTGTVGSLIPTDTAKKLFAKDQVVAGNKAKKAIQASLKTTLGSQFTKEEGERVENRTFDAQLDNDANIEALKAEKQKIIESRASKEGLFRQYNLPYGKGRSTRNARDLSPAGRQKAAEGLSKKLGITIEAAKKKLGL